MFHRPSTQLVGRNVHRRLPTFSTAIAGLAIAGLTLGACTSVAGAVNKPTANHSRDFAKNHRVPVVAQAAAAIAIDQTQDSLRKEHLGIDPSTAGAPAAKASSRLAAGQLRRTAPKAASAVTFMDPALLAQRKGERTIQSPASAVFLDPALQTQRQGERTLQSPSTAVFMDPALQTQRTGERGGQAPSIASQSVGMIDETQDSLRKEHLGIAPAAAPVAAPTFVDETSDSLRKEHLYIAR